LVGELKDVDKKSESHPHPSHCHKGIGDAKSGSTSHKYDAAQSYQPRISKTIQSSIPESAKFQPNGQVRKVRKQGELMKAQDISSATLMKPK
jgi:hypothetical protein